MRYKLLGPSGLRVSEICLGTMSMGDAWGFGADEKESHRILDAFAEAGGNFIDTANKYHDGQSEEILGSFLGPDRDRWVVATIDDLLSAVDIELTAGQLARLDDVSRIELGFPYSLLTASEGQMVYGDLEPNIDLPPSAPYRSLRTIGDAR